jgi:hypothetical protein
MRNHATIFVRTLLFPRFLYLSLLGIILLGCEDNIVIPVGALDEQMVDIQGQWQVARVWLNNEDITDRFDFGQIVLTLQMNSGPTNYEIETGDAPFPILDAGSWSYDDVAYPTVMNLQSGSHQRTLNFTSPPISGDSQLSLTFMLGCPDNVYTYEFRKQ